MLYKTQDYKQEYQQQSIFPIPTKRFAKLCISKKLLSNMFYLPLLLRSNSEARLIISRLIANSENIYILTDCLVNQLKRKKRKKIFIFSDTMFDKNMKQFSIFYLKIQLQQ